VVDLPLVAQDGHAHLGGQDELVALEQALRHVVEHHVAGRLHQQLHAPLQVHLLAQALVGRYQRLVLAACRGGARGRVVLCVLMRGK
jgi:hypothetical protein